MPHIYLDEEEEEDEEIDQIIQKHILDHDTPYCISKTITTSTQNSTVEKSPKELLLNIQNTIEEIVTCIALGEKIKLPITTRSQPSSQKYCFLFYFLFNYTKLTNINI